MPKKTKQGKGRLDKFYYLAKEQGFRSRAAFKLIQLNKKYDFLSQAKCVVDLCAAPGGWLQVCAKYMPIASIKIGVDLDPIPPIKGCLTFQADITTDRCMALIRKELKHFKADCVLNDGAPNVGANWALDAYNQIELSLYALKIATQTLRKGGWFITKVFRSRDYNALMYVANQLFVKVESNKPASSRSTSAEIFMVCQGYKAPDSIDPKLLDPKYALEEVEDDANQGTSAEKITSLKKLLTQKVNRSGYEDGRSILFTECDFMEFLKAASPHEYLSGFNRFKLSKEALAAIEGLRVPDDLEIICEDLKTCGRREFSELLKIRHKYQLRLESQNSQAEAVKEKPTELSPEQLAAEVDRELEKAIVRMEKDKKRRLKKDRKQEQKQDMMKKMSVIASTNINEDLELELDPKTRERMRAMMADEDAPQYCAKDEPDEADMDPVERRHKFLTDGAEEPSDDSDGSDDSSVDEKAKRVNRMADEIEAAMKQEKEYKMLKDKKQAKRELKAKALVDMQRQRRNEVKTDELLANNDLRNDYSRAKEGAGASEESENDDDLEEERMKETLRAAKQKMAEKARKAEEEQDEEEEKQIFLNPLLAVKESKKKKNGEDDESEWSDDDKYDPKETREERRERRGKERRLLGKKRAADGLQGDIDDVQNFFKNEFEEVPVDDLDAKKAEEKKDLPDGYSSMDSDDIAETRALAKKMLRKKFRTEMIDASFSRYAHDDDESVLPSWFLEDEAKHNIPNINLTKEEVDEEKRQLMEWNARPSKKVEEAKARKRARLAKAMNKVKAKAQVIATQDISEGAKMRQIQKMYTKEKAKHKEEKSYVVNRSATSTMGTKVGRNVKMVDSRMRADTRNQKNKKKGKGGKGLGRVSKRSKRIAKK